MEDSYEEDLTSQLNKKRERKDSRWGWWDEKIDFK